MNKERLEIKSTTAQERRYKLRQELKGASISQIEDIVDGVVSRVKSDTPNESLVTTYKKLAEEFPQKLRLETTKTMLNAINSPESATRKKGMKALVLLNAKTTLSAVEPYFTKNQADNEDLIQIAQEEVIENIGKLKLTEKDEEQCNISTQIHNLITRGKILDYIVDRDHLPKQALKAKKHNALVAQADALMRKYPYGVDINKLQQTATEIALDNAYHVGDIENYLNYRNLTDHAESTSTDPSLIFEIEEEKLRRKKLRHSVEAAIGTLKPHEKEILEGRYINDNKSRRILEGETNPKKDTFLKEEIRALTKLRHPSRRNLLRPPLED